MDDRTLVDLVNALKSGYQVQFGSKTSGTYRGAMESSALTPRGGLLIHFSWVALQRQAQWQWVRFSDRLEFNTKALQLKQALPSGMFALTDNSAEFEILFIPRGNQDFLLPCQIRDMPFVRRPH